MMKLIPLSGVALLVLGSLGCGGSSESTEAAPAQQQTAVAQPAATAAPVLQVNQHYQTSTGVRLWPYMAPADREIAGSAAIDIAPGGVFQCRAIEYDEDNALWYAAACWDGAGAEYDGWIEGKDVPAQSVQVAQLGPPAAPVQQPQPPVMQQRPWAGPRGSGPPPWAGSRPGGGPGRGGRLGPGGGPGRGGGLGPGGGPGRGGRLGRGGPRHGAAPRPSS